MWLTVVQSVSISSSSRYVLGFSKQQRPGIDAALEDYRDAEVIRLHTPAELEGWLADPSPS
ncbi:MAG: hypothetical protein ACI8XO_002915 [Verrucomicrobiales bacterium]|jgi:hypothetical protein